MEVIKANNTTKLMELLESTTTWSTFRVQQSVQRARMGLRNV